MSRWALVCLCPPAMMSKHEKASFFQFYSNGNGAGDHRIWPSREEAEKFMRDLEVRYPHMHYQVVDYDALNQPDGAQGGT